MHIIQRLTVLLITGMAALSAHAAVPAWKLDKAVEFVVPDSPGGGQDRTVRAMQRILQDNALVMTPISIMNKPGGSGNIAYTYLNQYPGDGHYLAIATATMLTNHVLGLSRFSYTDFTPAAILYGEYIGFAANPAGPLKSGKDMVERLRKDPESVTFAFGTSRGNANHIALALVAKAAGVDPRKLKVVIFKASIDATTALMGGHVDVVATPTSTYAPLMGTGKVRIIGIAAPQRIGGVFADVYEADPLECPKCKGPMRVIALIEDPGVIRRILEHLGQWAPLATERSPPPGPTASWPRHANLPLTYHPVPDIA